MMYSNYYFNSPKTCCAPKTQTQSSVQTNRTFRPRMNVIQNEQEIKLEFAMAGVSKEDIRLNVDDQVLTLEAQRKQAAEQTMYLQKEWGPVLYKTRIRLPENANAELLKAEFKNGILKLNIGLQTKPSIQIEIK